MPDYWLDSDTFIESKKRYYAFDIAPGFWKFIEEQAVAGVIASPSLVYKELTDGLTDELAQWVKDRKQSLFVEPDRLVQVWFTDIANYVKSTYPVVQAERFLAGADPWLIAHAKAHGGIVVTLEKRVTGGLKAKIPNVCDNFGVESIDVFEMLRRIGARGCM